MCKELKPAYGWVTSLVRGNGAMNIPRSSTQTGHWACCRFCRFCAARRVSDASSLSSPVRFNARHATFAPGFSHIVPFHKESCQGTLIDTCFRAKSLAKTLADPPLVTPGAGEVALELSAGGEPLAFVPSLVCAFPALGLATLRIFLEIFFFAIFCCFFFDAAIYCPRELRSRCA